MVVFSSFLHSSQVVANKTDVTMFSVSPNYEDYGDDSETSYAMNINIPSLGCQEESCEENAGMNYIRLGYPDGVMSQLMYTSYNKDKVFRRLWDLEGKVIQNFEYLPPYYDGYEDETQEERDAAISAKIEELNGYMEDKPINLEDQETYRRYQVAGRIMLYQKKLGYAISDPKSFFDISIDELNVVYFDEDTAAEEVVE